MESNLNDIDITKEELNRFGEALKQKEFRDLLLEYCEEMTNPASRKQYEEEITQLEKERGVDITFVNPKGEYVIKTSVDGSKIAFVNICTNEHVGKPSATNTCQEGSRGQQWSLPHLLSPPRNDMNNSKKLCTVFDVMFHPDTLNLSSRNTDFRNMVNKIACEAIESNFNVVLDKGNLKFPKLKYKGVARPLVMRKKVADVNINVNGDTEVDKLYSDLYKMMDEKYENKKRENPPTKKDTKTNVQKHVGYTTPKFLIKHRSDVDIQDYTYDAASKINATVPKELIVEINLPLLKSASDIDLDVSEKTVKITSEKPAKYKLDITLPYPVNEERGNAKFDVDYRKLVITLPVKSSCKLLLSDIGRYDSGVDSDSSPVADSPSDKSMPLIEELDIEDSANESQCSSVQSESEVFRTNIKSKSSAFLKPDLHYLLPEYSCHIFNNILSFTLNVKNVNPDSIEKQYNELFTAIHVKFSSISSGYFPVNYAFFINLPSHFIDSENLSIEAWDNNVIVQIPYKPCDKALLSYYVGTSQDTSEEKIIEEPSIVNSKGIENMTESIAESKPNVQVQLDSDDELTIVVSPDDDHKDADTESSPCNLKSECVAKPASSPQNIKCRSLSESSVDESSFSHSPGKSILKSSHRRHLVSRSVSESSIDDFTWSSSFENCAAISESLIPEETEISSSMKKTVRFSDVVSKQLFR